MRYIFSASLLLSSLLLPAAAVASTSAADASASTVAKPVSTGVTSAYLVHTTGIQLPSNFSPILAGDSEVVLTLTVDEQGKAQNIQLLKSSNPVISERVVEAVQQFRWKPATLDKQPIPREMTLNVEVQR
ncbi:MAG: TonB family protein [Terracidiphilus sp.]|nr:TonB family protein [Terracidiphilus sp.]